MDDPESPDFSVANIISLVLLIDYCLTNCFFKVSILCVLCFQGKSALWSHLIQFQDREEKQEHLTDSPGKKVLG